MLNATVDSRSGTKPAGCDTCCCEPLSMRPGETNLLVLNYASWAVPLGGRGLGCVPQLEIEQMQSCPVASGADLPPQAAGSIIFIVPASAPFNGDLRTYVADPEGAVVSFKLVSFHSTTQGKITLNVNGTFMYSPQVNFNGQDSFFFTASDGTNNPVTYEAVLLVGAAPAATFTPVIFIDPKRVIVNQNLYTLSFPIEVSPAAVACEAYRINVRQNALDCNYKCFWHVSCYDVVIKSC